MNLIVIRNTEDLHFVVNNEIYKTSTKYPTKFIIDVPEVRGNFKQYFDEQLNYFNKFPANSLFIYQNHGNKEELQKDAACMLPWICNAGYMC